MFFLSVPVFVIFSLIHRNMLCAHPILLCMLIVILVGVLQNLLGGRKKMIAGGQHMQDLAIGVVIIVPTKHSVETVVNAMLHAAARPELLRFYVAKLCEPGEEQVSIFDMRSRVATRVYHVRARHGDKARLRSRLISEVSEAFTLVLTINHQLEMGWDDELMRQLSSTRDSNALISSRLGPAQDNTGYLCLDHLENDVGSIKWLPFSEPPKRPQISICASSEFIFGSSELLQRSWPSADSLNGASEDMTLTASLWMHGANFYAAGRVPFWLPGGAKGESDLPGPMRYPPGSSERTKAELYTHLGIRRGRVTSRSREGLSANASAQERFSKLGQTFTVHRDL